MEKDLPNISDLACRSSLVDVLQEAGGGSTRSLVERPMCNLQVLYPVSGCQMPSGQADTCVLFSDADEMSLILPVVPRLKGSVMSLRRR